MSEIVREPPFVDIQHKEAAAFAPLDLNDSQ